MNIGENDTPNKAGQRSPRWRANSPARLLRLASPPLSTAQHPIAGDALRIIKRYLATREDKLPWLFLSER